MPRKNKNTSVGETEVPHLIFMSQSILTRLLLAVKKIIAVFYFFTAGDVKDIRQYKRMSSE